jgi:hypothetical protein
MSDLHKALESEVKLSAIPADILHDRIALALVDVGITYVPQQERDPIYDKLARSVALALAELVFPDEDHVPSGRRQE